MAKQQANTTMVVKDVQLVESGENQGDLVIAIEAKRAGKKYNFPYHIKKRKIPEVDIDFLKQKVRADIDALEAAAAKEDAIIGQLRNLKGTTVKLD